MFPAHTMEKQTTHTAVRNTVLGLVYRSAIRLFRCRLNLAIQLLAHL